MKGLLMEKRYYVPLTANVKVVFTVDAENTEQAKEVAHLAWVRNSTVKCRISNMKGISGFKVVDSGWTAKPSECTEAN